MNQSVAAQSGDGTPVNGPAQQSPAEPSAAQLVASDTQDTRPSVPDHELIRLIGRGSYGQVWLAKNAVGTLRAIKVVYRATFEKEEHFEREFKGLQKFEPISRSHDGFVDILQLGRNEEAGFFYYVMELADDSNAERGTWNVESTLSHASDTSLHRTGDGQGEGKSIPSS